MIRSIFRVLVLALLTWQATLVHAAAKFENTLTQRTLACTACHGNQGRAGPDGYYPRLAGKPAGYLYNQLLNFRDGRRHYGLMTGMVTPLSDAYLMEIAQYFSKLEVPYPQPLPAVASKAVMERGRLLVTQGDASQKVPACVQCHGAALTGVSPNIPGLLGLPRDYLNAQLGAWQTGQRQAQAPDCMAHIAGKMSGQDIAAVTYWLASQDLPGNPKPAANLPLLRPTEERMRCGSAPLPATPSESVKVNIDPVSPAATPLVAQGAYLARAGNCMACHTTVGGAPFAGGRSIATPFGTVFSSNITPDRTAGIGMWSSTDFWQAMHHGRSKDGRLLNPAFPYTSFTQVTRADSDALLAYLQTVNPVKQTNRAHALRWPFGTQMAMTVWQALYFKPVDFQNTPSLSAEWNRGAYLVRGLGHCGSCHTPRNALGASQIDLDLSGGMIPLQNWYAPSLRSLSEAGVSEQNAQHVLAILKTGVSPTGSVSGPMAEVVQGSTQYLSVNDLSAMNVYLKSLAGPSPSSTPPVPKVEGSRPLTKNGAKLYETHCADCHGSKGEGVIGAYPPLANNRVVSMTNTANMVQKVLYGGYAPATQGNPRPFGMPPFILKLNDQDTAELLTYIRNDWGNHASPVTALDVNRARERP